MLCAFEEAADCALELAAVAFEEAADEFLEEFFFEEVAADEVAAVDIVLELLSLLPSFFLGSLVLPECVQVSGILSARYQPLAEEQPELAISPVDVQYLSSCAYSLSTNSLSGKPSCARFIASFHILSAAAETAVPSLK